MCTAGRPSVTLNGNKVSGWAFDQNNVLSFEMQAGFSAWLQFTVLPGGPLFLGTMAPSNTEGFISDKEFQVRLRLAHSLKMVQGLGAPEGDAALHPKPQNARHKAAHCVRTAQGSHPSLNQAYSG